MAGDSRIEIVVPAYAIEFAKVNLAKSLRVAGRDVVVLARQKIRSAVGGGRLYYGPGGSIKYRGGAKTGRYRASAPGQAPVNLTGETARSLRVRSAGKLSVRVIDAAFQAKILEAGAQDSNRVMAPRPFMSSALTELAPGISRRLADAAIRDMVMERLKK